MQWEEPEWVQLQRGTECSEPCPWQVGRGQEQGKPGKPCRQLRRRGRRPHLGHVSLSYRHRTREPGHGGHIRLQGEGTWNLPPAVAVIRVQPRSLDNEFSLPGQEQSAVSCTWQEHGPAWAVPSVPRRIGVSYADDEQNRSLAVRVGTAVYRAVTHARAHFVC